MRDQLLQMLQLKEVDRTGWVRAGVNKPESVAAHSWGMATLSLKLCPKELDLSRVLSMCLVHDLAEVIVGDLTPHDEIRGEEKHRLEREAMVAMAPEWVDLFDEYESASTPEAKFVKTMDKLDMGLQAIRYTEQDIDLSEFISSARKTTDETDLAYLLE